MFCNPILSSSNPRKFWISLKTGLRSTIGKFEFKFKTLLELKVLPNVFELKILAIPDKIRSPKIKIIEKAVRVPRTVAKKVRKKFISIVLIAQI